MGNSSSNSNRRRRLRRSGYPHPHLPPPHYYYPSSAEAHPHPPLPPPPPQGYFSTEGYVGQHPLPPPPPQSHPFYYSNGYTNAPMVGRLHYHPFYANQGADTASISASSMWNPVSTVSVCPQGQGGPAAATPPPYVEHQSTKKIRNDVNLHKDTLRLEIDDYNPDHHLVSFVFDALFDGSITIFYLAKEEEKCRFVPIFPEASEPITFPFQKGVGLKFRQPSGTGIDLGFFELDDLSKPSATEDVFPLVICAETSLRTPSDDETPGDSMTSPHMQITQAVLEKSNGTGPFQVKVVRQILWIDEVRYELRELYGIGGSTEADFDDNDPGKECVICMTEPKDTAVLPCRHMCMCNECAKELRFQSNKCPICRQPIEELIEIKINNDGQWHLSFYPTWSSMARCSHQIPSFSTNI